MRTLGRGDLRPEIVTPPPGPRSLELCRRLEQAEAPGINTLAFGDTIHWREALGANVLDVDGNRYVDLTSGFGVSAVGHRHPRVVAAVRQQSARLIHGLGDVQGHALRAELAERLRELVPVDDPQVYFAISGADAVEAVLKTALLATGKTGILAFDPGYHGLTLGALAVTSRPELRRPFDERLQPHVERAPFGWPLADLDDLLERKADTIGCVICEPIVGREGTIVPPPGWLPGLAEICRRRKLPLIADEIFTGFGRTGRWFAVEHEGVRPDLVCCGKALGGGLPIAAVVGRRELLAAWQYPGEARHTATFVAHPLGCAAALATLEVIEEEGLLERATAFGRRLGERLGSWPSRFPTVGDSRGRGLLRAVELQSSQVAKRFACDAMRHGVLLLVGAPSGAVAQLTPPLNISEDQLDSALEILERILARE